MNWLSARQVAVRLGVARSSVYHLMANHAFPKPIKIGGKRVWDDAEVTGWIAQRYEARET